MPGIDINPSEFFLLLVLAVIIIGPQKLPEYAAKLAQLVKQARGFAEGARSQLREQMGPEFDDIDWKAYDPRQYDPRRIVRDALLDDDGTDIFGRSTGATASRAIAENPYPGVEPPEDTPTTRRGERYDPYYTPFDIEAT